jgi:hypothetical protein
MAGEKIRLTGHPANGDVNRDPRAQNGIEGAQGEARERPNGKIAEPRAESREQPSPGIRGDTEKRKPGRPPHRSADPAIIRERERTRKRLFARKKSDKNRAAGLTSKGKPRATADKAKPKKIPIKPSSTAAAPASTASAGGLFAESKLAKLLLSFHLMGAQFLKIPELQIDDKESAALSKAVLDVFAAWGVPEVSDKAASLMQLGGAMVTIYGTRAVVYARRHSGRAPGPAIPPPPPQGNVYGDAARGTQAAAAARPAQPASQQPATQPQPVIVRPNGGYVQAPTSPFGDQDGMNLL